jgi:ribosome-associated toxin RatA of RatAB toxin-antitoxin module
MATGSMTLHAPAEDVFAVLADYQRYVEWAPDVVASAVLAKEGDIVVADFLSPFLTDEKYVLEFVHSKPHSITYKQVDQYGARGVQGSWRLDPQGGDTMVTAHLDYREALWHRTVSRRRAQLILDRRLDSLATRLPGAAARGEEREFGDTERSKLFEALAQGEAFTVWSPRARYVVTRVKE